MYAKLEQAIQRAIPLVEAQTRTRLYVTTINQDGRVQVEVLLDDEWFEADILFTEAERSMQQDEFEGWVYEVLLTSVETLGDEGLGGLL